MKEYYNKCVGVQLPLLPTVLGLKLAVDLELGSKYVRLRFSEVFSATIPLHTCIRGIHTLFMLEIYRANIFEEISYRKEKKLKYAVLQFHYHL